MGDLILKFNMLDPIAQREVINYMDFLRSKKTEHKKPDLSEYKKKILDISVWSEKDLKVFDENNKLFNQWKPKAW